MNQLQRRISVFTSLPFAKLDGIKLQQAVREIGQDGMSALTLMEFAR
ncbi:MAG: hypothetical protein ACSLEZ_12880 [Thiobacillus sp.]